MHLASGGSESVGADVGRFQIGLLIQALGRGEDRHGKKVEGGSAKEKGSVVHVGSGAGFSQPVMHVFLRSVTGGFEEKLPESFFRSINKNKSHL